MTNLSKTTNARTDLSARLALLVTLGFFGVVACVAVFPVPEESREILYSVIGTMGTGFAMVLSYYFGSSRGGDDIAKTVTDRGQG